jgi:hypothetical protein
MKVNFNINLPIKNKPKYLKELSSYNSKYYELQTYGDWLMFGDKNNNILHQAYDESCNCYTYAFGRFEQISYCNDIFIKVLEWTITEDILENIDCE